ncbi:MAG: sugar phosphate isomerase/epimerase, partial [Treponema sp.]|nr:sugar phosphate isomerase/epimerase [Treponema sp.]
MENLLGLSSGFFKEPSVEKWKTACAAGFTEVELCPGSHLAVNIPAYLETAETEYSMISRAGLRISSFHLPYGAAVDVSGPGAGIAEKAVSDNKIILDWAAGKGIGIAVLHASFEPVKPEDRPARLAQAIASIEKLSGYARERNIRLAVEDLPRTCLGNCADEMLALTNQGKSAAICFDVNHLLSKESHRKFFEKTSAHIITVHFSDYDRIDERHWIPGDGCIDWRELIGLFTRAGYRGRYLFELNEDSSPGLGRPFSPRELKERFFEISADHSRKMFYVCGQDSVFEIDTEKSSGTDVRYAWTWNKKETSGDLPGDIRESNAPVNDCKSVGNGTRILVTDGYCTLLLEKKTKKALFYAYTPNSHSSALLPGNRIAVALSTAKG